MIPRIAHTIWLDEPFPKKHKSFWRRFRELHPTWDVMVWDDSSRLGWMQCYETFLEQDTWAGKSDVLRYELLARFGGVYLDTDVEPLKPLDPLLDGPPFVGWEDDRLLCPTVMGSEPGHPAAQALLERLPRWSHARRRRPPNHRTGPYFLTAQWARRSDVRLLPPVTFYPVHWSEKRKLGGPYPAESYTVHHWNAGWIPGGPPQRA